MRRDRTPAGHNVPMAKVRAAREWYRQKLAHGTAADLAGRLGLEVHTVEAIIHRYKRFLRG